jgi:molybdenum cofactor cytidylyltransferase
VIAAVVLAAGLARRMGRQKLLLHLQGKPVVRWAVERLSGHVEDVVVVTGTDDAAMREALADLTVRFVVNPRPQDGQGSSIAIGAAGLKPWTRAAMVALGDQPRVPDAVPRTLIEAFNRSGKAIVTPVYRGVQGTPVLFSADVFAELRALTGDAGARAVVTARPERVEAVAFDFAMPPDVDTPEDYAKLHVQ